MPTFLHVPFAAIGARALLAALCGTALVAQDEGKPRPKPEEPHFVVRRYPQDRDVAIAVVGSRSLTLGDLASVRERLGALADARALRTRQRDVLRAAGAPAGVIARVEADLRRLPPA